MDHTKDAAIEERIFTHVKGVASRVLPPSQPPAQPPANKDDTDHRFDDHLAKAARGIPAE
ncbi:hypothetical protein [Burkholderia cenocepacia]|uniref:hypothetical protein n=1 Tax=Burkholderia cenocepacia TaxID=95486 RepID=UPI0011B44FFA|nr:hypothetical protein [Burkholderia cenocepacia]